MATKRDRRRLALALLASAAINLTFLLAVAHGFSSPRVPQPSSRTYASLAVGFSQAAPPPQTIPPVSGEKSVEAASTDEPTASQASIAPLERSGEDAVVKEESSDQGPKTAPEKEPAAQPVARGEEQVGPEGPERSTGPGSALYSQDQFLLILQDLISRNLVYPRRARQRGTEGTVVVSLNVAADGSLIGREIQSGSGSSTLDRAALALIDAIFPVAEPPRQRIECTVGITYRLN